LAALLHAWHVPPQATLQHTPSTQKPLAHWPPPAQLRPIPCGATQWPVASQK
jgi:hypothetical protein